jgi:PadR family transcriptional regulator, regulatory protein PadR
MAFRGGLDALVLGVLQNEPMHGYEITKRINAAGETAFRLNEGQLYPILHQLENEGRILAEWIQQEGKPARKVYRLTDSGHLELSAQLAAWDRFKESVNRIMSPALTEAADAH